MTETLHCRRQGDRDVTRDRGTDTLLETGRQRHSRRQGDRDITGDRGNETLLGGGDRDITGDKGTETLQET